MFKLKILTKKIIVQIIRLLNIKNELNNRKILRPYKKKELLYQPIFVLGPPRCGSTLFYQAITHLYKFSYFSNNMVKQSYFIPYFIKKNKIELNYTTNFSNNFGATEDGDGPHEAYPFWRRFYPRKNHDYINNKDHLSKNEKREIASTIKFLEDHYRLPFISKNLEMSLRLKSLQEVFPNALYVILERDPRAIASSLIDARIKINNNKNIWWSMRPKNYENILLEPYHMQVAHQIIDVYSTINNDLRTKKTIKVQYEEFCDNPKSTINMIEEFIAYNGIKLEKKNNILPSFFKYKNNTLFNENEINDIDNLFKNAGLSSLYRLKL